MTQRAPSVTPVAGRLPAGPPASEINLALFKNGSWTEASSFAYLYIHHPLFAVDGLTAPPSQKEQWVPDRRTDKKPWFTVHLARAALLSRIVVYHDGRYSHRVYTVRCLRGAETVAGMEAAGTKDLKVVYPMTCPRTDAVRLDFTWDPFEADGHIRIVEIEAWGR